MIGASFCDLCVALIVKVHLLHYSISSLVLETVHVFVAGVPRLLYESPEPRVQVCGDHRAVPPALLRGYTYDRLQLHAVQP